MFQLKKVGRVFRSRMLEMASISGKMPEAAEVTEIVEERPEGLLRC